jgi:hypothetical protein
VFSYSNQAKVLIAGSAGVAERVGFLFFLLM